jgi:hypothetical protein
MQSRLTGTTMPVLEFVLAPNESTILTTRMKARIAAALKRHALLGVPCGRSLEIGFSR